MRVCCLSEIMRKLIAGCIIALITAGVILFSEFYPILYRPLPRNANGTLRWVISLEKYATANSFVRDLKEKNLIQSSRLTLLYLRLLGYSNHLKAGIYEIKSGETAAQLIRRVVAGDVLVLPFRIVDGTTQSNLALQVSSLPFLIQQSNDWSKIAEGYPSAEGLLLADTYHYEAGSQSTFLLKLAHQALMNVLNDAFAKRDPGLPYKTPYELLIAASIIEKEASKPSEKRLISGVIVNRLRKHMPLQMDPTVIYALGPQFRGKLTHDDLGVESPYNTYKHYGLPPTPIAMVDRDAIDAAAHPAMTNYLYFVASGEGCHHFSESYAEQKKAISDYKLKVEPCQN